MRAFAQAVADGDLEGLVAVLDPAVVSTSDGGGRAVAARKPLHGADRVARAWVALGRKARNAAIAPTAAPIELNGRLGLLSAEGDGNRSVISFVVDGGRIANRRRTQPGEAAPRESAHDGPLAGWLSEREETLMEVVSRHDNRMDGGPQ